jgi:ferritin-like metal-binding protein YciE
LWIERVLAFEVLPQLRREADSEWLVEPFDAHLEETRVHAERLEGVFVQLGAEPTSAISTPLEGLRRQHDDNVGKIVEPRLRDIFLAGAAAKTEHLELALYASLIQLAPTLGVDGGQLGPLEQNRREEAHALEKVEAAAAKLRERLPA